MKYFRSFLSLLILVILSNRTSGQTFQAPESAQSSIDWPGTYIGTIPCRDCEGIRVIVRLNSKNEYQVSMTRLGKDDKPVVKKGSFDWQKDGTRIVLKGAFNEQFMVAKNRLIRLNEKGEAIQGSSSQAVVLKKSNLEITEKNWKLMEVDGKKLDRTDLKKDPFIIFKSDSMIVRGFGGCNRFNGSFSIGENNTIQLSQLAATMMDCPAMLQESRYMQALGKVEYFQLLHDSLILQDAGMRPVARFAAKYLK